MSNGPDDPSPFPPPFFPPPRPRPPTRRDPFGRRDEQRRRREERRQRREERRAGLPNVIIPVPLPTRPITRPISFPTGPAANDAIFSRAGPFLRIGGIITAVAVIIDKLIRVAQEKKINREQREREQEDRRIARRLGRDNPLQVLQFPEDFVKPRSPPIEQVPPLSRPETVTLPVPKIEPLELPEIRPLPPSVPLPSPGFEPGPIVAPSAPPSPAPAAPPVPVPAGVPGIGSRTMPVFVPPVTSPFSFPIAPPFPFPLQRPVQFPVFRPIGDPLTPIAPPVVPLPLQPGTLELPQSQPQPQNRRCPKPRRRKKKRAQRRDKCFKGLFREGPFDDQVSFRKWVEIDCSSGRELGKRKRPTGIPDLRSV